MKKRINHSLINKYLSSEFYDDDLTIRDNIPMGVTDDFILTDERYDNIEHLRFYLYFLVYSYER